MTIDPSLMQIGTRNSALHKFATSRSFVLPSGPVFLALEEVVERYRKQVSEGILRNWRSMRIGPSFIKIGTPGRELFLAGRRSVDDGFWSSSASHGPRKNPPKTHYETSSQQTQCFP